MPNPLMPPRPFNFRLTCILLSLPALLAAQTSSAEEERLQKLMMENAQAYVPKNHITVGFHLLSSGGKVNYGGLGEVPSNLPLVAPATDGAVTRSYNNGQVSADALRANEKNADGTQRSIPGGRYQTTTTTTAANGTITTVTNGDFLSYTPGLTRNWSYSSGTQVTSDGHIGFSTYSATSEGGMAKKNSGPSAGVEFEFSREMGSISKRMEWGFVAGVALNGINNKTSGAVTSTLHTATDYYSLNGQVAPAAPYSSSSAYTGYTGSDGIVYPLSLESTVPISAVPDSHSVSDTPGGVVVNGKWQVKGAYFLMRLGPNLRAQLTKRISLTASIGIAGAYVGSTYSVVESFALPNLPNAGVSTPVVDESTIKKFVSGYYADFNVELALNERTGLFGGLSTQKLSGYDQTLSGRTAHVDLGSAVGLRGGVSYRF